MGLFQPDKYGAKPFYSFLRSILRIVFRLYFRGRIFHVERVPERGGVLLVANHQSFLDPIVVGVGLRRECHYIARDTLFRNPLFRRLIVSVNAFPVRRGAADVSAVKEILRRLRDEQAVVIFPESTRSRDGTISPFNRNSLAIAQRAGVPIIPTLIDGTFEAMPRGAILPRPYRMHVVYCEPVTAEQAAAMESEEIARVVEERMQSEMVKSKQLRAERQ